MAKILRVCNIQSLPTLDNRDDNYIYFVYDKMQIYLGKNYYSDPFCIVDAMPKSPMVGMLYILMDGSVKSYIDKIEDIGSIESADQLAYLKMAGTSYFMYAESRYLDLQTRTIQLPFQNGMYQLTVDLAENTVINNNTVLKYDETTGSFIVVSDNSNTDNDTANALKSYTGVDTNTVKTNIQDGSIKADLKISSTDNNLLKIFGNGLYATTSGAASKDEFNTLATMYAAYKTQINALINQIQKDVTSAQTQISDDSIAAKILAALTDYEPTVQTLLKNYDTIYDQLGYLKESVGSYTEDTITAAKTEIMNYLKQVETNWTSFTGNDTSTSYNSLTTAEQEAQAMVLEEFKENLLLLRAVDSSAYTTGLSYYLVTDDNHFDNVSDVTLLPASLTVTSEEGSVVGNTYLTVSPTKDTGNKYYYKATDTIPKYHDDVSSWTSWNGTSEITIENGTSLILVESNSTGLAVKYAKFTVVSRLASPKELDILDVTCVAGTTTGYSKLTVTPSLTSGNSYRYKKATTIPEYNSILVSDYISWNGTDEINASSYTDGDLMCLVECSGTAPYRALKVGLFRILKQS